MFKKTVKFKNFNDEEVERDFYFHISKVELMALASDANSMQDRIKRIIETQDVRAILEEFRELVKLAVGVRSEDGERFIKDAQAQSTLLDSPAFDELLFDLISKPDAATDFIKQLIPEQLQKELEAEIRKQGGAPDPFALPQDDRPAWIREDREPSDVEVRNMSKEQLSAAYLARHRKV